MRKRVIVTFFNVTDIRLFHKKVVTFVKQEEVFFVLHISCHLKNFELTALEESLKMQTKARMVTKVSL